MKAPWTRARRILFPGLLAAALLLGPYLGVLGESSGGSPSSIVVPEPREGEVYRYLNPDGGVLKVAIGSQGPRSDGLDRDHRTLGLEMTWSPAGADVSYTVSSAADRAEGLVVQAFARCGVPAYQVDWDQACLDERGMVLFASGGIPAGFGSGPFWGEEVALDGKVTVEIHPITSSQASFDYLTDPWSAGDMACGNLTVATTPSPHLRPLERLTPLQGPITLCDGLALPYAFTSVDGTTWQLDVHEPGGDPIPVDPQLSVWDGPGDPLPLQMWDAPFVVDTDDPEDRLPVPRAHEVAMELNRSYKDLFENGTDPLVVSTDYEEGTGSRIGLFIGPAAYEREDSSRRVTGMDATGKVVSIEVILHRRTVAGQQIPGEPGEVFEVRSTSEGQVSSPPTSASLSQNQAEIAPAIELARERTDRPVDEDVGYGMWATLPGHGWDHSTRSLRTSGYTIVSYHEDPTPVRPWADAPYSAVFDGPTGATLWVVADNRTLRP